MIYRVLADLTLIVHLSFILFILFGGLLAFRWPRIVWLHLPTVAYGAAIEFIGWVCPLTPLEVWLRRTAGQQGYEGSFVENYLVPIIYPAGLTPTVQIVLGSIVLGLNAIVYGALITRHRKSKNLK